MLGEFDSPKQLMDAAKKVREAGYRRIDAFAPFPVEGLSQALGLGRKHDLVPLLTLTGGLGGGLTGFFFQLWVSHVGLSHEHRRPPAEQLAGIHSGNLRIDRAWRFHLRRVRDAGVEQVAAAASSAF